MKILLATDGSEYSKGAAQFLKTLKLSTESEIIIFHAVYWIPFLYDSESYIETFKEIKQEIAPRIVDSIMDILKPARARISISIVVGSPAQCIIDAVRTSERFMGIGQLLTMPMFFASNAIYPLDLMSHWLRILAQLNPLTYLVDALRGLMIVGGESVHGYGVDFAVLFAVFVMLLMVAVKLYPTLVE